MPAAKTFSVNLTFLSQAMTSLIYSISRATAQHNNQLRQKMLQTRTPLPQHATKPHALPMSKPKKTPGATNNKPEMKPARSAQTNKMLSGANLITCLTLHAGHGHVSTRTRCAKHAPAT